MKLLISKLADYTREFIKQAPDKLQSLPKASGVVINMNLFQLHFKVGCYVRASLVRKESSPTLRLV